MRKLVMALAVSGATVSGEAHAQAVPVPRVAPQSVYDVAPALGAYTDEVLFGEVWRREGLGPRDRSLVTVSALITTGRAAQLRGHLGRALDNGVKPEEIAEIIAHLAFYAGWPVAISAVQETKAVFDQRGIGTPVAAGEPLPLDEEAEARRRAAVQQSAGVVAPPLADLTDRVLFGDLWRRPALAPRDRSLVTVAALIASGQAEQMPFHVNRAMDAGLTEGQLSEVVTHLAFYAGWPRSMSAVPVVQKILADRQQPPSQPTVQPGRAAIRIERQDGRPPTVGPASNFTGMVRVTSRFQAGSPTRVSGGIVSFEPGARTAWHSHPLGQTLIVTAGCGWVQQEGGPVQEIRPGDTVWFPSGVKHWHGATPDSGMTHVAIAEAQDGVSTSWMEQVTEAQYAEGAALQTGCPT